MIDFKLTNSGDFTPDSPNKYPSFKLTFVTGEYPVCRIVFRQGNVYDKETETLSLSNMQCKISFYVINEDEEDSIVAKTVLDDDELRQRILIALRTELNSLSNNLDFGSDLQLDRHEDITQQKTLDSIQQHVYEIVAPLLTDPQVYVRKELSSGTFYCQNVNVYIYDGDTPIYTYQLEG